MAWTWLAILAGAAVDVLTASTGEPVAEPTVRRRLR